MYEKVKGAADQLKTIFNGFIMCYYIMILAFFGLLPQVFLDPTTDQVNRFILYGYLLFICISMYTAVRDNMMVL